MNCLSPSILAADFACLGNQIRALDEAGAHYVHIDVMDGKFVESISFGIPVIKSVRKCTERIFDVHLMVDEPARTIELAADAGADIITIHQEACADPESMIDMIKSLGLLAGVAINPDTSVDEIEYLLPKVDMVLIMTVFPGYGGQKLIPECIDKVRDLRRRIKSKGLDVDIEVDGGITIDNVAELVDAGANVIVAGSAVFQGDIQKNVEHFLDVLEA